MLDPRRLCLYMPYWACDCARRDLAAGPGAAVADRPLVLTRRTGATVLVEACDRQAARLGLRPGITLGQAQAIVPGVLAVAHEPARDRAALRRLADWAVRFSPLVEPLEPDALLIDITGCAPLFGTEARIVQLALAGLAEQGFSARAAVADTVGAAYALAYAGEEDGHAAPPPSADGDHQQPGAAAPQIVPPGQTPAYLAPLPPAALRIPPQVVERLDALGVRTIGDLLMLPRAALPARFGLELVQRLQQALGEVFEGVAVRVPADVPHARLGFEQPLTETPLVQQAAERLLAAVFEQLRRLALGLRQLDCVLYWERRGADADDDRAHRPPTIVSLGLARASPALAHVRALLAQRLEPVDFAPGLAGLMLVARETARWQAGQIELFEPRVPEQEEALAELIDRLAGRLGYRAIVRPELLDDHQPERACRFVSLAEAGWQQGAGKDSCGAVGWAPRRESNPRPVQLLPRPVPIRVMALVPDGPPTWFAYGGREYRVVAAEGPERLETAWWRGPDVRRDYFHVTAETGAQFWVYHDFAAQQWYLHGIFV